MNTTDKFILTHAQALQRKYGAAGWAQIEKALASLVRADAKRGIASRILCLDDVAQMAPYGPAVPAQGATAKPFKQAIDRIAAAEDPHYLLLIGGADIVPLVPLKNPAYSPGADDDKEVPSDLPYACERPYSVHASRYLGPTRVVGRLPDLPGAKKPELLLQFIRAAARSKPLPRSEYTTAFGLTAALWQNSTDLSLSNTFGPGTTALASPPGGPQWSDEQLAPRMHFINCHGAQVSPDYYGQSLDKKDFPVAHHSPWLRDKVSAGTVVAAECCYGAQLFDPAEAEGHLPMALAYLKDGASGFFGSTTIAYGPSEGNGSADLICQYVLQQVLAGASLGRAVLEARLKFAGGKTHLDPYDLKTLAQFVLLGDPSLHPVAPTAHALTKTQAFKSAFADTQDRTVRQLRRERAARDGAHLARALPALKPLEATPLPEGLETTLQQMVQQSGLAPDTPRLQFEVQGKSAARRIHVAQGAASTGLATGVQRRIVALVMTEQEGQLIHVRRLHSR